MAFRHGMISTMLRNRNQKDLILKCCLISSVVFGLIHLANVVQGADPIATLLQAVTATCLGIFFAAIYVNCGNLLPCMIVHALHDIYAISIDATVSEQASPGLTLMASYHRYASTINDNVWVLGDMGNLRFRFVRYKFMISESLDTVTDLKANFEENEKQIFVDDNLLAENQYVYDNGSLIVNLQ